VKIAVVGLGYVGSVTSACFAAHGHRVNGVDVSQVKVDQLNAAISPVHEPGLALLIQTAVTAGTLRATTSLSEAWADSEAIIISVGTPTGHNGDVRLDAINSVTDDIGALLKTTDSFKIIVVTSTVPPGTLRTHIQPALERASGKRAGHDFGLCFSPEFLREGTAVADFTKPEKVVIGSDDERSTRALRELFSSFTLEPVVTTPEVAESVKFASNAWHALKVAFANEIGRACSTSPTGISPPVLRSAVPAYPRTCVRSPTGRGPRGCASPSWRPCSPAMRSTSPSRCARSR